jgi:hypothetical protein
LVEYKYAALKLQSSLRLLRLRPTNDKNHDIDAELAEFELPESIQGAGDAPDDDGQTNKGKNDTKFKESLLYEAVSRCWSREKQDQLLRLHKSDKIYAFNVSKNLKSALWRAA